MNTEQKLANTHIMRIPKKIELLDMADTSLQKVCLIYRLYKFIYNENKTLLTYLNINIF